jgi:hypothetical protein
MKAPARQSLTQAFQGNPLLLLSLLSVLWIQGDVRTGNAQRLATNFKGASEAYVKPELDDPKPDCNLEFPLNNDRDMTDANANCLETVKEKLGKKRTPDTTFLVIIDGHCDSAERPCLSSERARRVREFLVDLARNPIEADDAQVRDLRDECLPKDKNRTKNRVEIWIVQDTSDLLSADPTRKCAPGSNRKHTSTPP